MNCPHGHGRPMFKYNPHSPVPKAIRIQLCDRNMKIADECWLRPTRDRAAIDLNEAPWAVKDTTYFVYVELECCPDKLGSLNGTCNNIIHNYLVAYLIHQAKRRSAPILIRVIDVRDWDIYFRGLMRSCSVLGAKSWRERFRRLMVSFFGPGQEHIFPSPFYHPQLELPSYNEAVGLNGPKED